MGWTDEDQQRDFSALVGKVLARVENQGNTRIEFETVGGEKFALYHDQDCCESVQVEDINGDLSDLLGEPVLFAEERTSGDDPEGYKPESDHYRESYTWTFYRIGTIKGTVVIRWLGESNGYYSESVTFAVA